MYHISIPSDTNECLEGTHGCDLTRSRCVNTNGGFHCKCLPGYIQSGNNCRCEGMCCIHVHAYTVTFCIHTCTCIHSCMLHTYMYMHTQLHATYMNTCLKVCAIYGGTFVDMHTQVYTTYIHRNTYHIIHSTPATCVYLYYSTFL